MWTALCGRRRHRSSNGGRIRAERGCNEDLHRLSLALLNLVAAWADETSLAEAVGRLPERLVEATRLDWSHVAGAISAQNSLITLGRGPTLAIAQEAALKLKEICNLHAEAYSGAEFQHGPIALVTSGYPILIFMPGDESAELLSALCG